MQPGPFASPVAPPSPPKVGPSLWWFAVAGAVAVGGIIVAIVIFATGVASYFDKIDDFERVEVPGTGQVALGDTGGYSIYHEYFGASDDDVDSSFVQPPTVTITDPTGNEIDLDTYSSTVTYDTSGHEGLAMWTFNADQPGTYTVQTDGDPESTVAIGRGLGRGIVTSVIGAFAVGGVAVVAGVVIAIVVGIRRSQNRNRLRPPLPPPGPPGWGTPGWGAPQWGTPAGAGYPPTDVPPGYGPGPAYPPPGGPAEPQGGYGYPPPR